jgi:hypothetical protein
MDEFDPIPDLKLGDWSANTKSINSRLEDVVDLARATLIIDVDRFIPPSGPIKPGLNLSNVSGSGETGYIDAADAFQGGKRLPTDRHARLPRVAILLSPNAFNFRDSAKVIHWLEKPTPLSVMRHEMVHAVHNEMAIGWLLKWRDEITNKPFDQWIRGELAAKRISAVDFELVTTGTRHDDTASQALAWTEGFLTGMPFLAPTPSLQNMHKEVTWPAAIGALKGATPFFNIVADGVKVVADRRIRAYCKADGITPAHRKAVIDWLDFLAKPPTPHSPSPDEVAAVTLIRSTTLNQDLLTSVRDACKP